MCYALHISTQHLKSMCKLSNMSVTRLRKNLGFACIIDLNKSRFYRPLALFTLAIVSTDTNSLFIVTLCIVGFEWSVNRI